MTQFHPELVAKVKQAVDAGMTPVDVQQQLGVPIGQFVAVNRAAEREGWDAISATLEEEDVPEEAAAPEEPAVETMDVDAEPEKTFGGNSEPVNTDPSLQESLAANVEETVKKQARRVVKTDKPLRGHKQPSRQDNPTLNRARRRRKGGDVMAGKRRLLADNSKLDPDFAYRWVLARDGRLHETTQLDDWELVNDAHVMDGQGGTVSAVAGKNGYNADKMVLVRKPKEWFDADREEKANAQNLLEQEIAKGPQAAAARGPEELVEQLKNSSADLNHTYVPKGAVNSFGRVSETA